MLILCGKALDPTSIYKVSNEHTKPANIILCSFIGNSSLLDAYGGSI